MSLSSGLHWRLIMGIASIGCYIRPMMWVTFGTFRHNQGNNKTMQSISVAILLFALANGASQAQRIGRADETADELRYRLINGYNTNNNYLVQPNAEVIPESYQSGSFMERSFQSGYCPGIELADCSGMEIHLRVDNTRSYPPFRGINLANKSGMKINQLINTSKNCPLPRITMRNTSGTKIFITDNGQQQQQQQQQFGTVSPPERPTNWYDMCPNISMADCTGLDISIRIDNRDCPVIPTSDLTGGIYGRPGDITMKDCSGIKIFTRINSSN